MVSALLIPTIDYGYCSVERRGVVETMCSGDSQR